MKIFDRLTIRSREWRLVLPVVALAVAACEKPPVEWRGAVRQVALPPAGDEGSAPVDAQLVLRSDGSPVLESITLSATSPADTAACRASLRIAAMSRTQLYSVWWSRRDGGHALLLSARSDDSGGTWTPPVPVDTTDRDTTSCDRPAPAVAADAISGYVHVTYFINSVGGAGVFFAHSMDRGELFHSPVPIMYGDRPSATAVAAADSLVVVAFEDPNGTRSQISLAMSRTWGHIFSRERPEASSGAPIAEQPLLALRHQLIAVGWHGKDRAIIARVGMLTQ